jgi:hypothetical protein
MEEEEDPAYCFSPDVKEFTESDVNEEERRLIEQLEKQQLSTSSESLPVGDSFLSQDCHLKKTVTDSESVSHVNEELMECTQSENDMLYYKNRVSNCSFDDIPEHDSHSRNKSRGKQKQKRATTVKSDAQWTTASEMKIDVHPVPVVLKDELNGIANGSSESGEDFTVDVLQHEFPPLPPSPVEEDDDEYSEILHPSPAQTPKGKADTLPEPFYRSLEPPGSDPCGMRFLNRPCLPEPPQHHETMSSLKTRSMDAGFSRGYCSHNSNSRREVSFTI